MASKRMIDPATLKHFEITCSNGNKYLLLPYEHLADVPTVEVEPAQEWIPASNPPEVWRDKNGTLVNYLVYMPEYGVDVGNYMKTGKFWLCMGVPCKVTHWKPLPKTPREER